MHPQPQHSFAHAKTEPHDAWLQRSLPTTQQEYDHAAGNAAVPSASAYDAVVHNAGFSSSYHTAGAGAHTGGHSSHDDGFDDGTELLDDSLMPERSAPGAPGNNSNGNNGNFDSYGRGDLEGHAAGLGESGAAASRRSRPNYSIVAAAAAAADAGQAPSGPSLREARTSTVSADTSTTLPPGRG
jgi:hypothetical protein